MKKRKKTVDYYKKLLLRDEFVQLKEVIRFLERGFLSDYKVVAKIYGKGMTMKNHIDLQEAIKQVKNELEIKED